MNPLKIDDVKKYVEDNIGIFHSKRLESLGRLELSKILKRKNPYLFKAKNILKAQDFVQTLLDAHLSSQEETIFGNFLEGLVIFISEKVHGGKKSSAEGIDLEFDKEGIRYIVAIKSGPNWGNSSQINRMKENFKKAKRILRTSGSNFQIVEAVNGCCYGKGGASDQGDYFKYCGQEFWEFISDNSNLYIELIEPLGHMAKEKNENFLNEYSQLLNRFTLEFGKDFCVDGKIDWQAILKFNSSK